MPKIVDHRERRAKIPDAVLEIIAEVGVAAVTLRDVATRSGWSTGVINHYVGGRDALLQLAFRRASWLSGERADQLSAAPGLTAFDRLESVVKSTLPLDPQSLALCRIYVFFYAEAATHRAIGVDMDRYTAAWRARIESNLREIMHERDMSTTHSIEIANYLVALSDGFAVHGVLGSVLNPPGDQKTSTFVRRWIEGALLLAEQLDQEA